MAAGRCFAFFPDEEEETCECLLEARDSASIRGCALTAKQTKTSL
jgi:hypothetical protein